MEQDIIAYISEELVSDPEVLPLQPTSSLMDSNIIDSVAFLNLVMFLEERYAITVADRDLTKDNFETVEAMCDYVRSRQAELGEVAS